jgi:hypothetical protein
MRHAAPDCASRLVGAFLVAICIGLAGTASAATITVDNTQNSNSAFVTACTAAPGDCSFWGALLAANVTAETDTIAFNIPVNDDPGCHAGTGVCRISAPGQSVSVTHPVIIDGLTQPGATANTLPADGQGVNMNLKIELLRSAAFAQTELLFLRGATIRGLVLARDPLQQNVQGAMFRFYPSEGEFSAHIEGNILGTFADGGLTTNARFIHLFKFGECFAFPQAPTALHVRIGGLLPAQRNWFVAGDPAIHVAACQFNTPSLSIDTTIQGNLFGTNKAGLAPQIADITAERWIRLELSGNPAVMIGGTEPAARNVFVRALNESIQSNDMTSGPTLIRVLGNHFGLGVDGLTPLTLPIDPLRPGAPLLDVRRAQIGGTLAGERNFFVANHVTSLVLAAAPVNALSNVHVGNRAFRMLSNNRGGAPVNVVAIPGISAYGVAGGNASLTYRVNNTVAQAAYPLTVEFYKTAGDNNPAVLLGRDTYVAAEAAQNKSIVLPLPMGVTLDSDDVVVAAAHASGESGVSEFSWYPTQLTFVGNAPAFVNVPATIRVRLQGLGPFRPQGTVRIADAEFGSGAIQVCTATLAPSNLGAFIAEGSCELNFSQVQTRTLYAEYDYLFNNFRSDAGLAPTAQRQITVSAAPVDEMFCDGFESPYVCAGRP